MKTTRFCCSLLGILLLASACRKEMIDRQPEGVPVKTEPVARGAFTPSVTLLGVLRAGDTYSITAPGAGTVGYPRRFAAGLRTGEIVRKGEQLASVENEQARFAVAQAQIQLESANADLERYRKSYEQGIVAKSDFMAYQLRARLAAEQLKTSQRQAATYYLVAPGGGRLVVEQIVAAGSQVAAGAKLAEIVSGGRPIVECSVSVADRERIAPGMRASFSVRGRDERGEGHVRDVAPAIDSSGTARAIVEVDRAIQGLVPGTGVELVVALEQRPDAITVPEEAVVTDGGGSAVFVVGRTTQFGWSRAKKVAVQLGGRSGGRVEIVSGLNAGDRVVVAGADGLSDDSIVTEVTGTVSAACTLWPKHSCFGPVLARSSQPKQECFGHIACLRNEVVA